MFCRLLNELLSNKTILSAAAENSKQLTTLEGQIHGLIVLRPLLIHFVLLSVTPLSNCEVLVDIRKEILSGHLSTITYLDKIKQA